MKRTNCRTTSKATQQRAKKLAAGVVLMMGLALHASAKDGAPIPTSPPGTVVDRPLVATSLVQKSGRARHWLQVGVASWYGTRFQGRATAGGERFDMYGMTCAHRTLPLGTWLRVTNLKNHRTAFVRVNDRGPVLEGRIVDLSFAAAQALGLSGIGKVRLEAVEQSDPELLSAVMAQLQEPVSLISLAQ